MEHVLSIYNSKTKNLVYKKQANQEPQTMFENWFFSNECDTPIKELHYCSIFYYSITEDFSDRKSGKVLFKKGKKGKVELEFNEANLFFENVCPCCGDTYSVGSIEMKTSIVDGILTYVSYDYDDEDYEETIIVPFNPFEFNFLGYNPWIPKIEFTQEDEAIVFVDSKGKKYTKLEMENLKKLVFVCRCECGNEFETTGFDLITEKVTSCGKCDKDQKK